MHDFANQVAALRPMLVRMARMRLRNEAWVEDAVSETVVAALEKPHAFAGRSSLQTWLVGILNHKTVNQIRRNTRERQIAVSEDGAECENNAAATTDDAGDAWAQQNDPQECLQQRQFMTILDRGIRALPANQGQAFMLRYWQEEDASDICAELGVTPNNLNVLLHRARLRLRMSLATH